MRRTFFGMVLLSVSCSAGEKGSGESAQAASNLDSHSGDDTQDEDSDDNSGGTCESLGAETCSERADCVVIAAKPLQRAANGEWCIDYAIADEPKGCMNADQGCLTAITLAAPITNPATCFVFNSSCIPQGWGNCSVPMVQECD